MFISLASLRYTVTVTEVWQLL